MTRVYLQAPLYKQSNSYRVFGVKFLTFLLFQFKNITAQALPR